MRMHTVTILKFHGGWAVQMDFLFENCTWRKSKRTTIPDQSYYNLLQKKLWRIAKNRIIVPCFAVYINRHGDNLGLVSGTYSSIFLDTDSVEGKGKKDI